MAVLLPLDFPNWVTAPQERWTRDAFGLDIPSNSFRTRVRGETRASVPYHLTLESAEDIKALVDWFISVRGRWKNVWVPSYHQDLIQAASLTAGFGSITIPYCRYTELQFPDLSRRHLAIMRPGSTVYHRMVTDAVDNGDETETLTLNETVPIALPLKHGMISYMRLMRLEDDILSLQYDSTFTAETTLRFIEVPNEVPASL